jgi:hypothetical protein
MCFVQTSAQAAAFALYNINWLVLYDHSGECLLRDMHRVLL